MMDVTQALSDGSRTWRDARIAVSDAGVVQVQLPADHAEAEAAFTAGDDTATPGRVRMEPGDQRTFWINVEGVRLQVVLRRVS